MNNITKLLMAGAVVAVLCLLGFIGVFIAWIRGEDYETWFNTVAALPARLFFSALLAGVAAGMLVICPLDWLETKFRKSGREKAHRATQIIKSILGSIVLLAAFCIAFWALGSN